MSEFHNRPESIGGHRRWLWPYENRRTDWRLDVREDGEAAGSGRRRSDLDNGRLVHYMRMGAIHSDIEAEREKTDPVDRRALVVKWLVALAVFWIVFRFVRL